MRTRGLAHLCSRRPVQSIASRPLPCSGGAAARVSTPARLTAPLRPYLKPARTPADLLAHLQARGLVVPDPAAALEALIHVGYYRLLIYMRPLQDAAKQFHLGTTFTAVLALYDFDRELRLLCLDAIERVEVALRAALNNEVAVAHGPHFYLDRHLFATFDAYQEFLRTATTAKYLAIAHYRARYDEPPVAPIWAVTEAITFGALSRLYSGLRLDLRKLVARRFGFDETVLVSWFRTLTTLRNMCAHHNRLWNATLMVDQPKQAKALAADLTPPNTFYARAVVLVALLRVIAPTSDWRHRLAALLTRYPAAVPSAMGFPVAWQTRALWK